MVALTELYCWSYLCWASSYFKATAVINMRLIVVVIIELLVMLKLCMIWSVLMIHTIILRFWNVVRLHIFSFNKTLMLAILDTVFRACFGGVCSCTSTNVFHRVVVFYICVCVCVTVWVCDSAICVCVLNWKMYFSKSSCPIDFRLCCCSCLIDFRLCCCSCLIDFRLCCMYTYCMTYKISLGWC